MNQAVEYLMSEYNQLKYDYNVEGNPKEKIATRLRDFYIALFDINPDLVKDDLDAEWRTKSKGFMKIPMTPKREYVTGGLLQYIQGQSGHSIPIQTSHDALVFQREDGTIRAYPIEGCEELTDQQWQEIQMQDAQRTAQMRQRFDEIPF